MAKPKRKNQRKAFPGTEPNESKSRQKSGLAMDGKRPMRWDLLIMFLAITLGGTWLAIVLRPKTDAPRYTFEVVNTYPSDPSAFTQGLVMNGDALWLGTGRKGQSVVRKTDLQTGATLKQVELDEQYFGEGLTLHNGKLYQLTWKAGKAFVYDQELNKLQEFDYEGEGWGLTSNGTELILSDGSSQLKFLDPETFQVIRTVLVRRGGRRVGQLNELEYVENGNLYANVYLTDTVYEIDPETGDVTALINLTGLWPMRERPADAVLNGIAFNAKTKRLLVTGKLCPSIWELQLIPVDSP